MGRAYQKLIMRKGRTLQEMAMLVKERKAIWN
jgi:hypothetical protein